MPVKPASARRKAPSAPLALPAPPQTAAPVVDAAPAASPSLPDAHGWWRALALALAFVAPPAGALLALLYWRSPAGPNRRFGRWCLALAVAGWLLGALFDAVHSGWQSGEWAIQPY